MVESFKVEGRGVTQRFIVKREQKWGGEEGGITSLVPTQCSQIPRGRGGGEIEAKGDKCTQYKTGMRVVTVILPLP